MFETLRRLVKESYLVKALLGALIISFGVFGIGDFIGTGGLDPNIAIKVGEREINVVEFQRRYDQRYRSFKESVGNQLPDSEMLRRSVMDTMIQEITRTSMMEAAAEDAGILVTDDQLRAAIRNLDAFQDETGNFSQMVFNQVLADNTLTESAFLDLMRGDLSQRALLQPIALGGGAPGYLVNSLFTYRNEGRSADTLLVSAKSVTITEKPSDADLKTIYDQNTATFMQPEYRKLSAIALRATDLAKPESFAEEEVKTYYDQNAARYRTPAKRQVSQLVFDTKEEAEKVRAMAAPGDTLAALATKAGLAAPIDLGEHGRESIIGKSMGPAFELPVNELSAPIQSDLGWHIFVSTAVTPEHVTPYEESKTAIRQTLAEERGLDAVYRASTDLQDALAAGTPMADIATNLGVSILEIESIDQSGKDPNGADVPGLYDQAGLLSSAFSLPQGGDSGLRDLPGRDGYYVVKVESITPPAPKPLESVRADVTAIWQRDKVNAEARAIADKIAAEIGASTALASLETKDGKVSYGFISPVTRFGQPLDRQHLIDTGRLSAQMLGKLFAAKPGEVFTADATDGIVIVRLKDVTTPQPTGALAAARNQLVASVRDGVTTDMMEQMNATFATRYPVEVNNTVVDQMVKTTR